jgi:precorrin-2 dehydrogenase
MRYYPINLDIAGKKVVVVGGGGVAHEKVLGLLRARAKVTVIGLRIIKELEALAADHRIDLTMRDYQKGDLQGAVLAFGATDNPEVNRRIHEEAREGGIPFNAVDQPDECDFTVPSRVIRGDLIVTISTGGRAPFLSKALRRRLEQLLGPQYEEFTARMGSLRDLLREEGRKGELKSFFNQRGEEILGALEKRDWDRIDRLLQSSFGKSVFPEK